MTEPTAMRELVETLRLFAAERDWEQVHTPKTLAMALSVEGAEIVEHFQWLTGEESRRLSPEKRAQLREEIGDVLIYLAGLADKFGIDPIEAAKEKVEKNRKKYPAQKVRGTSLKYTDY